MLCYSFRDLQRIEALSHMSEIDMLDIKNDKLISEYLAIMGIDVEYGVEYFPANHRDISGYAAVGMMVRGEVDINRNKLNSPFGTLENKLIAAAYQDLSLCSALAELSGLARDTIGIGKDVVEIAFEDENICEDYESVTHQIKELYNLRDSIRGSCRNSAGSIKRFDEYEEVG